jgi:predicted ester cyclase
MGAEANKALVRRLYEAVNAGDEAAIRDLTTPEFAERLLGAVRSGRAQFDAPWQVLDLIAEGDRVAVHWKREGTHTGEVYGVAPTGKRVAFDGVRVWHLAGGKIAGTIWTRNPVDLLRELSGTPAAG